MPCNSQAVVRGTVDVSLAAALLADPIGIQALIARVVALHQVTVTVITQRADRLDLYLSFSGGRMVTMSVLATGQVTLNSREIRQPVLDSMLPLLELEVRKLGALSARQALIKGLSTAATKFGGRVVQNAPTANAGRQLVLALA